MTFSEYTSADGLNYSSLKDLEISPYRFWHLHVNPDRPQIPATEAQTFGHALHCAVLEGDEEFQKQFAYAPDEMDYPGCLVTIDDMRTWLKERGHQPKGTRKADITEQVLAVDPAAIILEREVQRNAELNAGKSLLTRDIWNRVLSCTESLREEPFICAALSKGAPEVTYFVKDPDTGVLLKARLDWVHPQFTLDFKTFTAKRGKTMDEAVNSALWYEGYLGQACFYDHVRRLADGQNYYGYVNVFVESEQPHEVRLRKIIGARGQVDNLYWMTQRRRIGSLIHLYAACKDKYGNDPWRDSQEPVALQDEDLKMQAW